MAKLEFEYLSPEAEGTQDEIVGQVAAQIESKVQALEEQFNALNVEIDLDDLPLEHRQKVEQKVEQARQRGVAAIRRLRKKLENHWQGALRQPASLEGKRLVEVDVDVDDSVNSEERRMVLQMLQEKKITLEQAEALLDALDGE